MANNFRISDQYLNTMKAISDRPDLYDRTGAAYMPTLSRDDLSKLQAAEDGMAKILGSTYFSDGKKLQSRLDYLAKNEPANFQQLLNHAKYVTDMSSKTGVGQSGFGSRFYKQAADIAGLAHKVLRRGGTSSEARTNEIANLGDTFSAVSDDNITGESLIATFNDTMQKYKAQVNYYNSIPDTPENQSTLRNVERDIDSLVRLVDFVKQRFNALNSTEQKAFLTMYAMSPYVDETQKNIARSKLNSVNKQAAMEKVYEGLSYEGNLDNSKFNLYNQK